MCQRRVGAWTHRGPDRAMKPSRPSAGSGTAHRKEPTTPSVARPRRGRGANRRPRKHSLDSPLTASGTVDLPAELPPRVPALAAPLAALVAAVPGHEESGRGRELAMAIKLAIGAMGIWMVTWGRDDWRLGLAGVLVALTAVFIPLSESRKRRLRLAAEGLATGRRATRPVPAELVFDGRKLTVRAEDRVYRSLRPGDPGCTIHLEAREGMALLALLPPTGRKRDPLWFATDAASLPPEVDLSHLLGAGDKGRSATDEWVKVFEAFVYRLDTA